MQKLAVMIALEILLIYSFTMRIGFAGWGTGGHVFPVQSLIKYIDKVVSNKSWQIEDNRRFSDEKNWYANHAKHELFWFGEKPSLEYSVCTKLQASVANLYFIAIKSGKRRREKEFGALVKNIVGLFSLGWGIVQSFFWLINKKVEVVFCKGWYVSLPVVIAGWVLRKRILLHESDTKPGIANRICSTFATEIFTGFEGVFPWREGVVGQILDDDLVVKEDEIILEWYENKKWDDSSGEWKNVSQNLLPKTYFLVTGWSQGSESVYKTLAHILEKHEFPNTHFYITLGTENQQLTWIFKQFDNVTIFPFVDQKTMGMLLSICDVAITRGGTTSLAEQEIFGIKKIIIPIPWTHDQYKNAQYYVKHHNDILIDQDKPSYSSDLEAAILSYEIHKKSGYGEPLETIRKPKEIIYEAIIPSK